MLARFLDAPPRSPELVVLIVAALVLGGIVGFLLGRLP